MNKYYDYSIKDMLKITDEGNEIFIRYGNKDFIIYWKKDKENIWEKMSKLSQGKYSIALIKDKEITEIQRFDTPQDLYENALIDGQKLVDIWDQVDIIDILGTKLTDLTY